MGKIIVFALILGWCGWMVFDARELAATQGQRDTEQTSLLTELESVQTPTVAKLVEEWRANYPHPSEKRVSILKTLVQRVKAEPDAAAQYMATFGHGK